MKKEEILDLLFKIKLKENIIRHVLAVENLALKTAELIKLNNPEIEIDFELLSRGALLHDIGRSVTHGIEHAVEGVKIAKKYCKDERVLKIIENHIGAGITKDEAKKLGLPLKDYIPITIEEKIVANSDNLLAGDKKSGILRLYDRLIQSNNKEAALRVLKLYDEIMMMII